jgi:Uma2 family endonuclease
MAKTATAPKRKAKSPQRIDAERAAWAATLPDLDALRQLDLPESDGWPMETHYHVLQLQLLMEVVHQHLGAPNDYYCCTNMFIYYSLEQAQEVSDWVRERTDKRPRYKGPDFFLVKGVDGTYMREKWIVWEEGGRYPNLIIEIVSASSKSKDTKDNKTLYAEVFHTPEYFWYDRWTGELEGNRLVGERYEPIAPNEQGWLWSETLGAWVGVWKGKYGNRTDNWLRLYDADGNLVPTSAEIAEQQRQRAEAERQRAEAEHQRAEAEHQRAEAERQRAERAEARLQRLIARLAERGIEVDEIGGNDDEAQL